MNRERREVRGDAVAPGPACQRQGEWSPGVSELERGSKRAPALGRGFGCDAGLAQDDTRGPAGRAREQASWARPREKGSQDNFLFFLCTKLF
jgi:hypothetical protein